MKSAPTSIPDLISRWETIGEFAAAIGCGYEAARQMRRRCWITPRRFPAVVRAAKSHGIDGVTFEWLTGQYDENFSTVKVAA